MESDYIADLVRKNLVKDGGLLLGTINSYPSDIDIVFCHFQALEYFLFNVLDSLKKDNVEFKIESPVGRISKYEKKIHLYENGQIQYQFDLWLVVQSKGRVYFNPNNAQVEIVNGISHASKIDYAKYKRAKVSSLHKFRFEPLITLRVVKTWIFTSNIIYFYGPDGIGKTTQIRMLANVLYEDVRCFHTRPKLFKFRKPKAIDSNKRSSDALGLLKSILYAFYWIADIIIFRCTVSRLSNVVFDRGPLEVFVQEVYSNMPKLLKIIVLKLSRSYNKGIVFTGDPVEVSQRKNEMSPSRTRFHLEKYEKYGVQFNFRICEVKTDVDTIHWEILKFYLRG
jgi:energy-coupling factor transporter ATP-binding protein EcfA2